MADSSVRFQASFLASGIAEVLTCPIDTAKVRLQVQKAAISTAAQNLGALQGVNAPIHNPTVRYSGMIDAMLKISKNEGVSGLWKGLSPALLRQTSYTSLSMVLYPPIRNLMGADGSDPSFFRRLMAGGSAGAIGIAVMNPTEVLKTQMQSNASMRRLRMGEVVKQVWSREGLLGFWSGVKPNVVRTFLVNAAELGTYDHAKHTLSQYSLFPNGSLLQHVTASGIAGFFSALTSTPADVIKTRLMNQAGHMHEYQGMGQALLIIYHKEGLASLYKGFIPILIRKLTWCTMFFVGYERLFKVFSNLNSHADVE